MRVEAWINQNPACTAAAAPGDPRHDRTSRASGGVGNSSPAGPFGVWAAGRELSAREADRAARSDLERENDRLRREIENIRAELDELGYWCTELVGAAPPRRPGWQGTG